MAPEDKAAAGPAGANGVVKKKRVVTTAADRERAKLKAEDARWRAAKTPDAKAWINSTRLLRESFSMNREDILALKVGPATRRDLWAKSDAMGLHVEMFDTRSRKDGPLESYIVIGQPSSRHLVNDKVREIQRQNKRAIQEAEDEAEEEDETNAGAEEPKNPAEMIDPSLREQRAPVAQMMLPGVRQAANQGNDISQQLPPIDQTPKATATETAQMDLPNEDIEAAKQLSDLKAQAVPARPVFRKETTEQEPTLPGETPQVSETLPQDEASGLLTAEEAAESDRIASWVSQQAQSAQTEKDIVDPTGSWKITCAAIAEQLGSTTNELTLTIHLEPTRPQSDNDTDDENPSAVSEKDVPEADLTEAQKARLGTYQLWATFELGLYQGVIRFMSPTTPNTTPTQRTAFDLLPTQLPSLTNRTFQYKWRGRETSDSEISVEAENATQWVKFEEEGVNLTGVFESEYLGETGFEGQKVGKSESAKVLLGKAWSEVSPQAHEAEAKQKE
ncbi:hypothetical protein D6C90_02038 [Aureobasidium pullulans]|uniref:Uncharacterized protein n=1 Tax=Aureobasidium pullulans TaxID=5580 RepID=A0A4S9FHV9_AURPU|nr:hypothetical protein D6D15_08478 [Aureobasidium pullulans]THX20809.1 hypothetical protein D6D12_10248 [Aureobasidium pullulans]THX47083.1 hypothetical protein D6D11_06582 [Aureobasidium pullulans]THY52174.1 hypothetical protein D6C97_06448 [Aureobasidium pullulans]THZ51081.1 hypothetical protein D6C90_02038 [Aureobasidium pullulans]